MSMYSDLAQINDLKKDIVIDEEAFAEAARGFSELCGKIDSLISEISQMLYDLQKGFDTPAGRKFMASCQGSLLTPLAEQKIVCTHIAENLITAKTMYQSVFDRYREVVNSMNTEA